MMRAMSQTSPQTLGRYRILEPLGEGGMGRVYLAEDPALGRRVAIKVLPADLANDPERRARLLSEARAASALNHPNIVTIHDVGEDDGRIYVAMERIEGKTLRAWRDAAPRTPQAVLALVRQAAGALAVAHRAGLVHRDLKPDNMMVREDGLLKIFDFGLVLSVARDPAVTRTMPGAVIGTATYMSPEQVLGQPATAASDVFSLAIVAYELLARRHPFAAGSDVETMHKILHETPKPPSGLHDGLSAEIDFVLTKALAKEPSRRYPDAVAFDVDLETAERSLGSASAAPVDGGPRSLAVLPFKNIGGNPDLNYLGVGLADAVITRLSESPDLIVRSTSTIARYENQPVDPMRVAQELQTTAVLDASFQKLGERFRATARLIGAPNGQSLWAGKVDLRFEDIFDVQDEVARGIAEALTARLTVGSSRPSVPGAPPSAEAYEAFMRGQQALRAGSLAGFLEAIEWYRKSIARAPGYVDAWAELANTYHAITDSGFESDPAWYVRAEEALARALALDPDHPRARFEEAALHLVRGRKVEAYRGLVHAIHVMPNQWAPLHYMAYVFRLCDRLEEAVDLEDKAIALDPTVPWPHPVRLRLLLRLGRMDEARAAMDVYRTRFPQRARRWDLEFRMLIQEGRYEEVVDLAEENHVKLYGTPGERFELALAMLKTGRGESADRILEGFEAGAAVDMDSAAFAASLAAEAGRPDQAFRHLARATELGNDMLRFYEMPQFYGKLFDDPRWPAFIAGVKERNEKNRAAMPWPVEGVTP
jgi:serine/threonine protein kinase/tetratricopeptide (TPR) repeat protein